MVSPAWNMSRETFIRTLIDQDMQKIPHYIIIIK